jgi:apolipoprotein D and lipocalin family protein
MINFFIKLTLALALIMFSGIADAMEVTAVNNFTVSRYLGNWYEIARLPNRFQNKCLPPIRASYSVDPMDTNHITVENICNTKDHHLHSITGVAYFVEWVFLPIPPKV